MNTDSLFLCLNSESGKVPNIIPLLPAGDYVVGRDGRRWTKKNSEAIVAASNRYMPFHSIDENHAVDLRAPQGESSPALGWFNDIHAKEDGSIWARVIWTVRGSEAIKTREYRYISPVFLADESGEITTVLRAALTNSPNLALPSLNSTQAAPADNPVKENAMNKDICAALGLAETASENDVLAAINALKVHANSAQAIDFAAYAPRADLTMMEQRAVAAEKQLAELNAARFKETVTAAVEKAIKERKIAPASRDEYIALCSTDAELERFNRIMAQSPEIISSGESAAAGTPPASASDVELNAEDEQMCKALGYSKEEWLEMKKGEK